MNLTPTPRVDAAIERWKDRPWAGSPTDRPLMLARELERELAEAKAHHQRDEALLVQRTDEIRHLEEQLKDAATRSAQVALEAYKRDLADIKAERDRLREEVADLRNAGGLPFIRSEAIRNLRDQVCGLQAERDQLRQELAAWQENLGTAYGSEGPYTGDLSQSVRAWQSIKHERDQLRAEVEQIRNTLQDGLDRDKDDTTTPHLAVVAVNALAQLRARVTELEADKARVDWIASRASTDLVHFAVGGWAIIKSTGGDILHDLNIHDLRQAIDAARGKGAT